MAVVRSTPANGTIWQTRLSREAAATYEQDLEILGLDRSEALRRGLRLLHREAVETRMARDVEEFYGGERAPLSDITASVYGRKNARTAGEDDGGAAAP